MSVTVQDKAKVIAEHQRATGDTGSPEVARLQLLTARINGLNDHFKSNVGRSSLGGAACGWCRGGASCLTI